MRAQSKQAEKSASTLDQLARHYDYSDAAIALRAGMSRSTVQQRRKGTRMLKLGDLEVFAGVFGVPVEVMLMDRHDAIRWVIDNVPGGGFPHAGHDYTGDAASTIWHSRYGARDRRHLALVDPVPA